MKKIFLILTLISLNSFGDSLLLKAPFAELKYESHLTSSGRLVIPPMVSEQVYREAVMKDCRQFRDTLSQFSGQLSVEEVTALVSAPVPYSMKPGYEVEIMFALPKVVDLKENGELHLAFEKESLSLNWKEQDLMKDVLKPMDSIIFSEFDSVAKLKITRRDILCGYLAETIKLNAPSAVYWKLSNIQKKTTETNLNILIQLVKPVLNSAKGKMLQAALIGRGIFLATKHPDFGGNKIYFSAEYIWNLLFVSENTLEKSEIWDLPMTGVYRQSAPIVLELSGLQ